MDLRTGPSAIERRTGARSLRGTILARPPPSCAHDHDRLRIPSAPPSRTSGAEKKESTVHRLSRAYRPYAKSSSISSFNHDISNARVAEDKSAKSSGVNKSAKVVLVTGAKQQARVGIGPFHGVEATERRYQHEQRRTRQVKIGQENIDRAKAITRRDEDRGLACERLDGAVLGRRTLQQPQR